MPNNLATLSIEEPTPTTLPEIPPSVQMYPDRFLQCRILMHNWNNSGLPWVENSSDGASVVHERLICARCDKIRIDQRSIFGRLLRRHYRQQPSYNLGSEMRKETLARERIGRILGSIARRQVAPTSEPVNVSISA